MDVECADFELGTVRTRAILRCQHLKRWAKQLNDSDFIQLGFKDLTAFKLHHALLDDEAFTHANRNSQKLHKAGNTCTHKGYRALYPVLDTVLDRQHTCFHPRWSHRREDITSIVSSFAESGSCLDRWPPTALLLFSSASRAGERPRKRKPLSLEEKSRQFSWTEELKIQLDSLQMLSLHFSSNPVEQLKVLHEFGEFSCESEALRDIWQMIQDSRHADNVAGNAASGQSRTKKQLSSPNSCANSTQVGTVIESDDNTTKGTVPEGSGDIVGAETDGFEGDLVDEEFRSAQKRRKIQAQYPSNIENFPVTDRKAQYEWEIHWKLYIRARVRLRKIKKIIPTDLQLLKLSADESLTTADASLDSQSSFLSDEQCTKSDVNTEGESVALEPPETTSLGLESQQFAASDERLERPQREAFLPDLPATNSNQSCPLSPPANLPNLRTSSVTEPLDPEEVDWSVLEEAKKFIAKSNAIVAKILSQPGRATIRCSVELDTKESL